MFTSMGEKNSHVFVLLLKNKQQNNKTMWSRQCSNSKNNTKNTKAEVLSFSKDEHKRCLPYLAGVETIFTSVSATALCSSPISLFLCWVILYFVCVFHHPAFFSFLFLIFFSSFSRARWRYFVVVCFFRQESIAVLYIRVVCRFENGKTFNASFHSCWDFTGTANSYK